MENLEYNIRAKLKSKSYDFKLEVNRGSVCINADETYLEEVKINTNRASVNSGIGYTVLTYNPDGSVASETPAPVIASYRNPVSGTSNDVIFLDGRFITLPQNISLFEYNPSDFVINGVVLGVNHSVNGKAINGYVDYKEKENINSKFKFKDSVDLSTVKCEIGIYHISGVKFSGQIPPRVMKPSEDGKISLYDKNTPVSVILTIDTALIDTNYCFASALYNDGYENRISKAKQIPLPEKLVFILNPL